MIEIDIVRSTAFDLRTAAATYRALMWGAATGKVKGVMASPPARTEGDEVINVVFAGGKGRPRFLSGGTRLCDVRRKEVDGLRTCGRRTSSPVLQACSGPG